MNAARRRGTPDGDAALPNVAAITTVAGRRDHLARQRTGLRDGERRPDRHVVVTMGEPGSQLATTGVPTTVVDVDVDVLGLPLAAARNLGAATAVSAGADVLVFLDVDVVPDRCLVQRYVDAVAAAEGPAVFCGPVAYLPAGVTDPAEFPGHPFHPARPVPPDGHTLPLTDLGLFWSLSFALDRATWERTGGFDTGYVGYGAEDTDFARRADAAGVALHWLGGAAGYHQHHAVSSPPVEHLDDILRNGARYAARWGTWPMTGWLEAFEALGLVRRDGAGWARVTATAATPAR